MIRFAAALAAAALSASPSAAEDLLIFGGPIHTGVGAAPAAEAVLVKDGKIAFVGARTQAERQAGAARRIDLKGAAAFPGFVDSHAHLVGIGMREMTLNLDKAGSVQDVVAALKAYADARPDGRPIVGGGWIETHWPEKRFPTRADLDRAAPDRPVLLARADGHGVVVNSATMKLAGVTRDTKDPAGGRILRDAAGEPTGMFIDNAIGLVADKMPAPTAEAIGEALEKGARIYAARGWTGIANMSVEAAELPLLRGLAAKGALPIRTDNYVSAAAADAVLKTGPSQDDTGLVRIRGVKLYMDGALGSRGAALLAPYSDEPSASGLLLTPPETVRDIMRRAVEAKAQIAMHAIGDRGNRLTLDAFEEAFKDSPGGLKAARWRVEHAQIVNPQDLPRFAKLGVVASMQPSHAIGDLYFAPARLGDKRLDGAYAWESLLKSGAVVAAGSDAPVEVGDPLIEFYAAVARRDLKGAAGPDWRPNEAVSRSEALKMLTLAGAYAAFRESELGTLEVGKRADISVFSKDLMTVPAAEILTAKPVLTVVDGKVVFEAKDGPRR